MNSRPKDTCEYKGIDNVDYYKIPTEKLKLNEIKFDKKILIKKHNIIIDSRQRNYELYPTPDEYLIDLLEPHRNVNKIELIAAVLPKSEYNVNSENNLILLTINGVTEPLYLTPGQYHIGSNIQGTYEYSSNTNGGSGYGFIYELQRVLNTHSVVVSGDISFNVVLVTAPSPNDLVSASTGTGRNASILNRVMIILDNTNNILIKEFTIDFTNGFGGTGMCYNTGSPYRLIGCSKSLINSKVGNYIYGSSAVPYICTGTDLMTGPPLSVTFPSILSEYDYSMIDDPKYTIMQLEFGNYSAERVESIDSATNQKFALIIYDANDPDNIFSYNGNGDPNGDTRLRVIRAPGRLKALKGSDFDKKVVEFDVPILIENFKVTFTKYDNTPYNFDNREHLLIFEISVVEFDPKYRN